MNKPFTIVVCTYNGERFLPRCLDALLALQNLDEYTDSIIVVDNNSSDGTKAIIESFAQKNPIIRYEFEGRQGLTYARQHAIKAETPWVIYVDDDNLLNDSWLKELTVAIQVSGVGVINGAVIATPFEPLTEKEQAILLAMHRNLACTHVGTTGDDDNRIAMGAGMCVRTDALEKIDAEGWLSLEGRKGQALSSGEDTELSERILAQGYIYHFNPKMKLQHLIPKSRLTEQYAERLIDGLVASRVQYLRRQKYAFAKLFFRKVKHRLIKAVVRIHLCHQLQDTPEYWKQKTTLMQAAAFLKYL